MSLQKMRTSSTTSTSTTSSSSSSSSNSSPNNNIKTPPLFDSSSILFSSSQLIQQNTTTPPSLIINSTNTSSSSSSITTTTSSSSSSSSNNNSNNGTINSARQMLLNDDDNNNILENGKNNTTIINDSSNHGNESMTEIVEEIVKNDSSLNGGLTSENRLGNTINSSSSSSSSINSSEIGESNSHTSQSPSVLQSILSSVKAGSPIMGQTPPQRHHTRNLSVSNTILNSSLRGFVLSENNVRLQKAKITFGKSFENKIPILFNNEELADFRIVMKHSNKLNLNNVLSCEHGNEKEDSSLPNCLQTNLLEMDSLQDNLTIKTNDNPILTSTTLYVNKAILSLYSPFFRQMMFGKMKTKNDFIEILDHSVMECPDFQNTDQENDIGYEDIRIFCIMIKTMYTLEVDCLECDAAPLLEIADKYMFVDLASICEAYLEKNLNEFNVLSCIFLENSKYQSLKTKASQFIAQKFFIICKNGQLNLIGDVDTVLNIISRDDLNVRTEDDILNAALLWVEYDFPSRKKYFPTLLNHIRLQYLSPECLHYLISIPEKYVTDLELQVRLLKKIAKAMSCQLNTIVHKVDKANQQLALHKTTTQQLSGIANISNGNMLSAPVMHVEQISVLSPTSIFDSSEVIGRSGDDEFFTTKPRHHVSGIVSGFDLLMTGKDLQVSNEGKTLTKVNTDGWSVNLCVEPIRFGQRKEFNLKVNKTTHGIINIGICKADVNLNGNLNYENGWCYYLYNGHTCHNFHSHHYDDNFGGGGTGDTFKVQVDLRTNGTVSFVKNGQPLGLAFQEIVKRLNGEDDIFYFAVALYSVGDAVSILNSPTKM